MIPLLMSSLGILSSHLSQILQTKYLTVSLINILTYLKNIRHLSEMDLQGVYSVKILASFIVIIKCLITIHLKYCTHFLLHNKRI